MKINNKEVKAVIFDLDGTLVDSCGVWVEVDIAFFKKRGIELPSDYVEAIGHLGLEKAAVYTINRFNLNEKKEDVIKEWLDAVWHKYAYEVKIKDGVKEFLKYLHDQHIPFCLATANSKEIYEVTLKNNGIYEYFEFIKDVTKYPNGKKDPDIYLDCCAQLNSTVDSTAIFEDLALPLKTSYKAGFITVGVKDIYSYLSDEDLSSLDDFITNYHDFLKKVENI